MEFLSQRGWSDILLNNFQALLIFDPFITLWGHFKASYFKMLNDATVASACFYVRACQSVRNSKNIATIRNFHLPSSFFCLSIRLTWKGKTHKLNTNIILTGSINLFTRCCPLSKKPQLNEQNLFNSNKQYADFTLW